MSRGRRSSLISDGLRWAPNREDDPMPIPPKLPLLPASADRYACGVSGGW